MKKLLGIMAITALAASAFAQGTVVIANQTGLVKQWTAPDNQALMSVAKGGGWVELFAAPKGTSLSPLYASQAFNYNTLAAFLTANPGWAAPVGFNGGVNPGPIGLGAGIFANGNATISGIAAGGSADYIILGWTGTSATVDEAITAWKAPGSVVMFGESAVATTATGDPTASPPGTPVFLRPTFVGMTLTPNVPEPSTFALAGLGAAAMLILRRRK